MRDYLTFGIPPELRLWWHIGILNTSYIFATIYFGDSSEFTQSRIAAFCRFFLTQVGGSIRMKTIIRSIGLGMLAALFIAGGSTVSFAQAGCDDTAKIEELDAKIRANLPKNSTVKVAVDAGKEFLEKFGACEATAEFTTWLKAQMPKLEERAEKEKERVWLKERFDRYDAGIKGEKYDDTYAAGKELLTKQPENIHIIVPMGLIGLYQSYNKNYKFNEDTLRFAKIANVKLKGGAEPKMDKDKKPILDKDGKPVYGVFQYTFNKEDAISELTYAIAYITYWAKNDKKGALPSYYEVTQLPGKNQNEPRVYATIGEYYTGEAARLGTEIAAMIEKQKAMATDEEKEKIDVDIKAKVGLFNGYTERAIDAFARAHKIAPSATAGDKTYKDGLYKTLQDLYKRRFDKDAGLNEYIAAALAKPFPNPTSDVTPINDPDPVTTTTTTTTATATPTTAKPVTNGKPVTKP